MRQLQQELDDSVKKQSMSEASLKVMSCYGAKLEAEAQDLKNNCKLLQPRQVTSQVCLKLNVLTVNMQDKVF